MTKLEQLIQDLCPNGVKMVKLGDVAEIQYGYPFNASLFTDEKNEKPIIRIRDIVPAKTSTYYMGDVDGLDNYIIHRGDILLGMDGYFNMDKWDSEDAYLNQRVCKISAKNDDVVLDGFLFHFLKPQFKKIEQTTAGGSVIHLSAKIINNLQIPLPPLAVQSEIVRLLDKFTLYKSELAAELAARCKQYEHYREKLFTFGDDVERKTLGEIGTFTRGRRFCRTDIVEDGQSCIHYGDIYTYYGLNAKTTKTHLPNDFPVKLRYAEKGDVVIVGAGENDMDIGVGVVWEGDHPVAVHDACYIFKHNINPRYVSHYLRTINYHLQIKKYVNRGKICSISAEGVAKSVIPIPSLEIQERIASILDRFDALCNDIKIGLPAEIELRQKQYEHYRDELLNITDNVGNKHW